MIESKELDSNESSIVSVFKHKIILDISCLPFLRTILTRMNNAAVNYKKNDSSSKSEKNEFIAYLPDTIEKLLTAAKEDPQYFQFFFNLIRRWTKKEIDTEFILQIIHEKKFENITIGLIGDEMVSNSKTYYLSKREFFDEDLTTHFSPPFNILSDVIGKILGLAELTNSIILMANSHLISEIKNKIPMLIDYTNQFRDVKVTFFEQNLPGLTAVRGARWMMAGIVEAIGLKKHNRIINLAGLAFFALDP